MRLSFIYTLFLTSSILTAGQSGPHREGDFWVETTTGSEAAGDSEQFKITMIGDAVVKGGSGPQVEYTLTRRVRARTSAEARDLLQNAEVSFLRHGRNLRLSLGGEAGAVNLQVTVPRSLTAIAVGTESGSVDVSDFGGTVVAQTGGGDTRINRVRGGVDVSTAGGTVHLGEIGGWAKVNTAGGDITADSVGGEARFETAGGDITIQKVGGNIRAITGGGKVRIGQAAGSVMASNGGGGAIDIGHAGGTVTAHNSGGGPILIGSAAGIQCENASGGIKAGSSGVMRITTASGNVVAEFQGDKLVTNSYVSTGSGDITVFLPSNLRVTVRAQNSGATRREGIISEFPGLQIAMAGGTASARGALNGGGPLLQIQGTSGTIWIKKK